MEEKTYNCERTQLAHVNGVYNPVNITSNFFDNSIPSVLATKILNIICNKNQSASKWKNAKQFTITWNENGKTNRTALQFHNLVESLKKHRKFLNTGLGLPVLPACWLDKSIELSLPFYAPCNSDNSSLTMELNANFGNTYPVKPNIDREGIINSGLINLVERNIVIYRNELISASSQLFDLSNGIWFGKLLCFINLLISSFDVTLVSFYNKAKYDLSAREKYSWCFDEAIIGKSITGRTTDKLKWIYQITGKRLPDLTKELSTFNRIRQVRNHLNHFDPPVFACTIEDNAYWINSIFDIAHLLIKLRESMNAYISNPLIELLLQPPVKFEPFDPGKIRHEQKDSGYMSCFNQAARIDSVKLKFGEEE